MTSSLRVRWRFSLGSLLALVSVVAVCAALYAARHRALQAQERAFRAIPEKGGLILVYPEGTQIILHPQYVVCAERATKVINPIEKPTAFTDADLHLLDHIIGLNHVTSPARQ